MKSTASEPGLCRIFWANKMEAYILALLTGCFFLLSFILFNPDLKWNNFFQLFYQILDLSTHIYLFIFPKIERDSFRWKVTLRTRGKLVCSFQFSRTWNLFSKLPRQKNLQMKSVMVLFHWTFANEIIRQFKLCGTLLNEILHKFFPFVCSD